MGNSDDDFLGVYIHHGGQFVLHGNVEYYVGGNLVPRFNLEVDKFGYFDLEEEIQKLGYVSWNGISYKIPNTISYMHIHTDKEVIDMLGYLCDDTRVLHIFVDHGKSGNASGDVVSTYIDVGNKGEGVGNGAEGFGDDFSLDDVFEDDDFAEGSVKENVSFEIGEGSGKERVASDIGEGFGKEREVSDSEEDNDYIPTDDEDYSDDDLGDAELCSDEEYVEARMSLRDKTDRGLCDEVFNRIGHECGFSDYDSSDGDINSSETDEEIDISTSVRRKVKRAVFDPIIEVKHLKLVVGMRFEDGFQAKEAIQEHVIEDGREIHFRRVSKHQMEASCKEPCKWRFYGSLVKSTGHFLIKVLVEPHTCTLAIKNKQVISTWIAKHYLNVFRYRPEITVRELLDDIKHKYHCVMTRGKIYKARDKAIQMLRGTVEEHYGKLRNYIPELKRGDVEGMFELLLDVGAVFKGIYVGFTALRKGFLLGCRRLIGIDGAHLKTYLGGVLLCAVGYDANNQMYPIAWAVVEIENQDNWCWFLEILMDDLGLSTGAGTTFISDQQKGLINAVSNVAPYAEHRNCARHVFMNWKKSHKGVTLKNIFWRIVRSTYVGAYNEALDKLKKESVSAYEDFIGRDTTKFCKAFMNPSTVNDTILNNISETFNGYILSARGKHVIHMLKEIRTSLMERQHRKQSWITNHTHRICPEILKKLEEIQCFSKYCIPHASSDVMFEVENFSDRFVVDLSTRTCTCRAWDISGIPCIHACAAIHFLRQDAADYVHEYYSVERYKKTYMCGLSPLNGEKLWPVAEGYPVIPPAAKKMTGMPKKKRKRNPCEDNPNNPTKLRKNGVQMTCQKCFQQGHNKRGCKNETVTRAPKPQGKVGRLRKLPHPIPQPCTATTQASSSRPSSTVGAESMGYAGRVHTSMPSRRNTLFIPPRPQVAGRTRRNKNVNTTQESKP